MGSANTNRDDPFEAPRQVARLMDGYEGRWWVAGGWALDLYLDEVTRPHEDLEIAVLRRDQSSLRDYLGEWTFEKAIPGTSRQEPWTEGERLERPIHEIHATRAHGSPDALEILLNEASGGVWRFRRNPEIARPLSKVGGATREGVPFLSPEVVLLYKAKNPRPRDEDDFRTAAPRLADEAAEWLRLSLEFAHPDHRWLRAL